MRLTLEEIQGIRDILLALDPSGAIYLVDPEQFSFYIQANHGDGIQPPLIRRPAKAFGITGRKKAAAFSG